MTSQKLLQQKYTNSNLGRVQNLVNKKSWLHTDYSQKNIQIPTTILAIIFWDVLMFHKIFLSPQVKRIVIISNKHGIYELPNELPNDFRVRILGNQEMSGRSQIFKELYPSVQSSSQNESFVNTSKNSSKNEIKLFP